MESATGNRSPRFSFSLRHCFCWQTNVRIICHQGKNQPVALAEVNQETGTILKDYTTIGEHTFRNVEKIMLSRQTLFVIDRTERTITGIPINELN